MNATEKAMIEVCLNWALHEPPKPPKVTSLDEHRRKVWLRQHTRPMPPDRPRAA